MQNLPTDNFKVEKNISIDTVLNTANDSKKGYMVMVDLEYSDEIKEQTKHYPLCPEIKNPPEQLFSEYMNKQKREKYKPVKKMILDQTDKYKYITH